MPFEKNESPITPEQEITWAQQAAEKGDWGQVGENLNELARKVAEVVPDKNQRQALREGLVGLETFINSVEISEDKKNYVTTGLERARAALE